MKRLGVFLLPPGWNASPSQGYPQHYIRRYPFVHLGGEKHCESFKSVLAKNTTQCPRTRARTRTARSGDECTNHEATAPYLLLGSTGSPSSLYEPHKEHNKGLNGIFYKISVKVVKSEIFNKNGLPYSIRVLFVPGVVILPI